MRMRGVVVALLAIGLSTPVLMAQASDQDKTFLTDATKGNWTEIDLAKLALEKSKNPDVRMFANKMVHDHTMLLQSMKPFAVKWGVDTANHMNAEGDAKYAELKVLTGETFDKAYIKSMVADHDEDLQKFDQEISSTQDQHFKAAVVKGRAVVKQHDDIIHGIASKDGIS